MVIYCHGVQVAPFKSVSVWDCHMWMCLWYKYPCEGVPWEGSHVDEIMVWLPIWGCGANAHAKSYENMLLWYHHW